MDLSNYSVKDFVLNESFQKWILEPDVGAKVFWENWLNANPDKIDAITEARSMIQSMYETMEENAEVEFDQVWNKLTKSIQDF